MNKKFIRRYLNNRGSIVELFLLLVVAGILLAGVYVYGSRLLDDINTNQGVSPIISQTPNGGIISGLTPFPTPEVFPTVSETPLNSSDEDLNKAADSINKIINETNDLDAIDSNLSLPGLDFSTGF